MCGIAGYLGDSSIDYSEKSSSLIGGLKYRGPDNQQSYEFENGSFVHTRLSILDVLNKL